MWTLRVRGPKGKAATVQVAPDDTLQRFCEMTAEQLKMRSKKNLTFRAGFPPRAIAYTPTDTVSSKFANNDTIVVDATTATTAIASANAAAASAASAERRLTQSNCTRSSRRATPKGAVTAPAARARHGVHTLHGTAHTSAAKKRRAAQQGVGVRLGDSLETATPATAASGTNGDEMEGEAEPPSSARKYRRTRAIHMNSKDDVATRLVQAVSRGGASDRAGKFFRAATHSAVDHQYQLTLATARLHAALSQKFEIRQLPTAQRVGGGDGDGMGPTGQTVEMVVRFKESVRKWKEETVTMLQPIQLKAALKYILMSNGETGREMLKPFNMAQLSPRVFWSIARLYNGDVAAGLAALLPDEDWSYLDIRTRQMSKKAIEAKANEESYKCWKKRGPTPTAETTTSSTHQSPIVVDVTVDGPDDEDATDVVSSTAANTDGEENTAGSSGGVWSTQVVRKNAQDAEEEEKRELRAAAARAALSRVEMKKRTAEFTAALKDMGHPSGTSRVGGSALNASIVIGGGDGNQEEEDDDDIEQTTTVYCDGCNKARILSLAEAATACADQAGRWTCSKLALIGRDASCTPMDDELQQMVGSMHGSLLAQCGIQTRKQLANTDVPRALRTVVNPLDERYASIKAWFEQIVDSARLDEVNDAMAEIVGGDESVDTDGVDRVGALELQKLGTPADLVETPPDLIVAALDQAYDRGDPVDIETVKEWQEQARMLIREYPWMGEWRTI